MKRRLTVPFSLMAYVLQDRLTLVTLSCCLVMLCSHGHGASLNYFQEVARHDDEGRNPPACTLTDCLSFVNFRGTIHLTFSQRQQIHLQRAFLRAARGRLMNAGAGALRHGGGVVEITPSQRTQILLFYGNHFQARKDLPAVLPAIQKRAVDICPRVQLWNDLILRLTDNDELIQVVQFDDDNRQWILEETCSQSICSFVSQCTCGTLTRLVRALVVNFDQTVISEKYIKVYCCIAKKISTT